MDHNKKIAAQAIAQRFLLKQLYMEKFFHDQQARDLMPRALTAITLYDAQRSKTVDAADIAELLQLVHEEVEQFFTDVEASLQPDDSVTS